MAGGRVFEIDPNGKERWSINDLRGPVDAVVVPGKRVLIAEYHSRRVSERDFTGKILWQKQVANPINVQRLRNGNTFIASRSHLMEVVDRAGKEVYTINDLSNISGAARTRRRLHRLLDAAQPVRASGHVGQATQEFRLQSRQ